MDYPLSMSRSPRRGGPAPRGFHRITSCGDGRKDRGYGGATGIVCGCHSRLFPNTTIMDVVTMLSTCTTYLAISPDDGRRDNASLSNVDESRVSKNSLGNKPCGAQHEL